MWFLHSLLTTIALLIWVLNFLFFLNLVTHARTRTRTHFHIPRCVFILFYFILSYFYFYYFFFTCHAHNLRLSSFSVGISKLGLIDYSPIRMRKKYTRVNILRCVFILRCANQPESKFKLRSHGFYRQEYFCR